MTPTQPAIPSTKFTPLQHEMLNLFGRNTPEEELLEIKVLIEKYFAKKQQKNTPTAPANTNNK